MSDMVDANSALTHKTMADNPPRMGRPPLGHVVITVRLPRRAIERIDAVAPGNQRARFIREAVEAELERREATAAGR